MKTTKELVWNVYKHDFNSNKIEKFNVFNSISFYNSLYDLKKKGKNYLDFAKELKYLVMYQFWSICEYEVVITSWPVYMKSEELERLYNDWQSRKSQGDKLGIILPNLETELRIDIYEQIMVNYDKFAEYVWNNLELIKKRK